MTARSIGTVWGLVLWFISSQAQADSLDLLKTPIVLRMGNVEWNEFSGQQTQGAWESSFDWIDSQAATLEWTQYDVKQSWEIAINGRPIAKLNQDENRMSVVAEVAEGILTAGKNTIIIRPTGKGDDDIVLGPIRMMSGDRANYLSQAVIKVNVTDSNGKGHIPTRITLLREDGSLAPHGLLSTGVNACRIGTVYSLSGSVSIPVPKGIYQVYAGRGSEYSLARLDVDVRNGEQRELNLEIERVIDTTGYAACDTHIHTLTHSGHGDASIDERMATIAGEGIELAIATDHNKYINFEVAAKASGANRFFTSVVGCEVTTPRGHFNVFPISTNASPIGYQETNWSKLFGSIRNTPNVGVIILNHARDLHSGVRPFAIENHFAWQGENAVGWDLGFNAMEVLNSAATQSNILQLIQDWMALLNSGKKVTPIGCSDSHDVARHFVGQGRTYVRCDDAHPNALDVEECTNAIMNGRVSVSYGIFVRLIVEGRFEAGDLANIQHRNSIKALIDVQTPKWITADHVQLYVNGEIFEERSIKASEENASKNVYREEFEIPAADYDAHVVAVVTGPGVDQNYWRCAKPYQPTSTEWVSRVFGCSGAVWLDRDGNGQRNPARDYALSLCGQEGFELNQAMRRLESFDRAVAIQFFSQLRAQGIDLSHSDFVTAVTATNETVQDAYRTVLLEIRNHSLTR